MITLFCEQLHTAESYDAIVFNDKNRGVLYG